MLANNFNNFNLKKKDIQTLLNFKNYEDIKKTKQDYSKIVVKKPWGYEYLLFSNKYFAMTILHIKKGEQTSLHCHPNKSTALFVLSGKILFSTLDKKIKIEPSDGCYIDKKVFHRSKSISDKGSYLLEIETPVNKQDLVRLKDSYGRKGKGYEKDNSFSYKTNNYNYLSFKKTSNENNLKKIFGETTLSFKKFEKNNYNLLNFNKNDIFLILNNFDKFNNIFKNFKFHNFLSYKDFKYLVSKTSLKQFNYLLISKNAKNIKVSDYVVKFLEQSNNNEIFVTPGSQNLHILDSLGRSESINLIYSYNSATTSKAAEGYSLINKKPAVVIISSGSASAEIFSSILNCWIESIPVIFIIGQAIIKNKNVRQFGIKEFKLSNNIKRISKFTKIIKNELSIKHDLMKAFHLSTSGRPGPSVLEIPINIQSKNINENNLLSYKINKKVNLNNKKNLIKSVKTLIQLLNKSKQPLIILGNGIKISSSELILYKFIKSLNIPILLSNKVPDLLKYKYKNNFGVPGPFGERSANFIIQNCDLLISLGCRLSQTVTGRATNEFAKKAKIFSVDIDLNELNKKNINIDHKANYDLKEYLETLIQFKNKIKLNINDWLNYCKKIKKDFNGLYYYNSDGSKITENKSDIFPLRLFRDFSSKLKDNFIIIADNYGPHLYSTLAFKYKKNHRLICLPSIETRGFSIPLALGAGINNKNIICITEIAGFQKNIYDLEFVKKYNINLKIILMIKDDNFILKVSQKKFFGERFITTDYSSKYNFNTLFQICNYFGLKVYKITNNKNYIETINKFLNEGKPSLLAVKIKDDQDIIPKQGFYVNSSNEWIPRALHNMDPYLNKSILEKNMLLDKNKK